MSSQRHRDVVRQKRLVGGLSAAILKHTESKGIWYSVGFYRDVAPQSQSAQTLHEFELSDLDPLHELTDWARDEIARLESEAYRPTTPTKL